MQTPERSRSPFPWRQAAIVAACAAIAFGGTVAFRHHQAEAAKPTGKLYVADTFTDTIGVMDVATGEKIKLMPSGKLPHNFALTADNKRLYVTDSGSQSVSVYDTDKDELVLQRIVGPVPDNAEHRAVGMDKVKNAPSCKSCHWQRPVGSFIAGITMSPDEKELWISEMKTQKVTVVDTSTLETKRQVEVVNEKGSTPSNIFVHPQTKEVYVLSRAMGGGKTAQAPNSPVNAGFEHDKAKGTSYLNVYDPSFTTMKWSLAVPHSMPWGAVFSADGQEFYVAYRSTDKVVAIDVARRTIDRTYKVDEAPIGVLLAPDDETLMVANFYETPATVTFSDRKTGVIKHRVTVPSSPTLMVQHPRTKLVYLTASGSNKIVEIDPRIPAVTRTFEAGAYPIDLKLVP